MSKLSLSKSGARLSRWNEYQKPIADLNQLLLIIIAFDDKMLFPQKLKIITAALLL